MDLTNVALTGLVAIGIVNVISFFKPGMPAWLKFALSAVGAFAVTWIPAEFSNLLLQKIKAALEAAFMASGGYKLAQKIGGN